MRREKKSNDNKNDIIAKRKILSIIGFLISIVLLSIAITLSMNEEKISREAKVNREALNKINSNIIVLEQASSSLSKDINEVKDDGNENKNNISETNGSANGDKEESNINSSSNTIETNNSENSTIVNSKNVNEKNTDNDSNSTNDNNISENNNSVNKNNTNNEGNSINEKNISENGNDVNKDNTNKDSNNVNKNNTNEENNNINENNKIKKSQFIMPVEGEHLTSYSMDSLVYSNTLGEWITHRGIDIKAEKTTVVKASANGTVKSIKNDPRYGLSITIEHENGFQTIYSSLLSTEFVKEGDTVEQGKSIGTVGNSAVFETADGSHLHFELLKDGEYVNPDIYIK